jgi:nuclear GTP-binding protein
MPKRLVAKKSKNKAPLGGIIKRKEKPVRQKSAASTNPNRVLPEGKRPHSYRDKATIRRLNLYNDKPDEAARRVRPDLPAMIEPDRRWFGNTRTISHSELDMFRKEVREVSNDPYSVLIKASKLPMALITDPAATNTTHPILDIEPYDDVFGPKARRKRPKLKAYELEAIANKAQETTENYEEEKDPSIFKEHEPSNISRDKRLEAGQSRRIWEELYKVLDSSDVICQVIDVRNPMGTRVAHIERQIKKQPHKHMILILNKCDLVPTWVTTAWVKHLSKEYPTVAFQASITNPFGKGGLIQLLRQFDKLHREKKTISIGFIGYPNVGKSSVINTLRKKAVCKVAPVPGETKVWQYITLTKRIYLIDCPGVVYDVGDSDDQLVLKGVVRPEKLTDATLYIDALLGRVDKAHISAVYGIKEWNDADEFMKEMANKQGRLLKGGEPDLNTIAKMLLHDWQRGKILYFVPPPPREEEPNTN